MTEGQPRSVILFKSTSHVMRAERTLLTAGVKCRLIPVPRELSSQCGICLRVETADLSAALETLKQHTVAHEGAHSVTKF